MDDLKSSVLRGEAHAAREKLRAAITEKPDDASLQALDATILFRLDNVSEAIEKFRDLNRRTTLDPDVATYYLRALAKVKEFPELLNVSTKMLALDPKNAAALRGAARAQMELGDLAAADSLWRRLADLQPNDNEAALQIARAAKKGGDLDSAEKYALLFLETYPTHKEALTLALDSMLQREDFHKAAPLVPRLFGVNPARAVSVARKIFDAGELDSAVECVIALNQIDSTNERLVALRNLCARTLVAQTSPEQGLSEAEQAEILRRVIVLDPGNKPAVRLLRQLAAPALQELKAVAKENDQGKIIAGAQAVLEIDPSQTEALFALGRALYSTKREEEAVQPFQRCVDHQPQNGYYWLNLARACQRSGRLSQARQAYGKVVELIPDEANQHRVNAEKSLDQVYNALAHRGRAAFAERDLEAAWDAYHQAVSIHPGADILQALRAIERLLLAELKANVKAEGFDVGESARRFLAKVPDHRDGLQILARSDMANRDYVSALAIWQRLMEKEPDKASHALQVARCCGRLKRWDEGLAAAEKAINLDANMVEARTLGDQFRARLSPSEAEKAA